MSHIIIHYFFNKNRLIFSVINYIPDSSLILLIIENIRAVFEMILIFCLRMI
jgi:hypothetical protein